MCRPASTATAAATAVTSERNREILGCDVGDSESEAFSQPLMESLRDRGLHGARLVITDTHRGLAATADRWFQRTARQRRRMHFIPNLPAALPRSHQHIAAALFRIILAQPDTDT